MNHLPPRASWVLLGILGYSMAGKIARHHVMDKIFGKAIWDGLSAERQDRAVLYLLSTINATMLTVIGLKNMYHIYKTSPKRKRGENLLDYLNRLSMVSTEREDQVVEGYGVLNLMSGYMLHDFVKTIHEWAKYKDQWFHHAVSLGLLSSVIGLSRMPEARSYAGLGNSIVIMDASTVFLNICWFLRETGRTQSPFYRLSLFLFVSLFFGLRLVLIPNLLLRQIWRLPHIEKPVFGLIKPLFVGALGLQFYWAFQIAKGLLSRKLA